MNHELIDVSVVIGFKNWGLGRLRLSIESLLNSFGDLRGEVIVSDYGSDDPDGNRIAVESSGARYVYTATDGTWSRTRALNAGFAVSHGQVLVSTDADMIFSPASMAVIGEHILADHQLGVLLQCRDLPPHWTDADVAASGLQWDAFERDGRRRPRWGMGGMMAVSRDIFLRLRGYDERMHTYGGEDIDFAQRVRRAGARLLWLEDDRVRMYHMWHPSTAARHERSEAESAAVEFNKRIMREDKTFVRNVVEWRHRPTDARPLVSVVISTFNRSGLLRETIHSVQAQTVQDFEIIVVDDGSTDDTQAVVASFDDPRISYIYQENSGIAIARNRGVDAAVGYYVAVLDDDDIALPWRLENQFAVLTEGVSATFGSFVNFDDESGEMVMYRTKKFEDAISADRGGAPGHSTWMVDRDLMSALRYDETITSGVDNNFALRSLRSGMVWRHSGAVHTLRRMHAQQVTALDGDRQLAAARGAYEHFTFITPPWTLAKLRKERGASDYVPVKGGDLKSLTPYLPDHLVTRSIVADSGTMRGDIEALTDEGEVINIAATADLRWEDLARFRGRIDLNRLLGRRRSGDDQVQTSLEDAHLGQALSLLRERVCPPTHLFPYVVELLREGRDAEGPDWAPFKVVTVKHGSHRWIWGHASFLDVADVARFTSGLTGEHGVTVAGPQESVAALVGELHRVAAAGVSS